LNRDFKKRIDFPSLDSSQEGQGFDLSKRQVGTAPRKKIQDNPNLRGPTGVQANEEGVKRRTRT